MSGMKILRTQREIEAFLARLRKRGAGVSPEILGQTGAIVEAVRKGGDKALLRYTRKFDGHGRLRLPRTVIEQEAEKTPRAVVRALTVAAGRIQKFHRLQREGSWSVKEAGITLGQRITPLGRVGVYVPGGRASYPSTVLMNVIPAQVAGVREIALTVPTPGGETSPALMAALRLLKMKEVYSVGGAQAVAALAYGTESIPPVDKIVGPGNVYVAAAKRMVFGTVDIDMIAGPSEILIIADASAEPRYAAADLLSQAEHDELASPVLLTDSGELARAVREEVRRQLRALARKDIARSSLRNYGAIIMVPDLMAAAALANRIAPEHLEVMTTRPRALLASLRNAGAVFLGPWTPEPVGDYAAGPNHTLPTGGTARWASPLGVYDFLKRTSVLEFTKQGFLSLAQTVQTVADVEGLEAHGNSIRVRRGDSA
jgi:histidinol dehydrogenase